MCTYIAPRLLIQCDWDSILRNVGAEAWISCKAKDTPGVHGKIRSVRSLPNLPSVVISEGFEVGNVSATSISVRHQNSPYTTVFIAPHKVYSGIHKGSIASLDVNEEGLVVSCSSLQNQLLVWDTLSEEVKLNLKGHVFDVYKCRFFPSGKVILSCGSDMTLKIWCAKTGQCPVTLKGHSMAVTDVDFVNRGKNILSASKDGKLKLWNCGDSSCIADICTVNSSINCCILLDAPASFDPAVEFEPLEVKEVDTKGKVVLIGCEDGNVEVIALSSRKPIRNFNFESAVNCITHFGDYNIAIGCQNGLVVLQSLVNLQDKNQWHESNSSVICLLPYKNIGVFISRADGSVEFMSSKATTKRISLTGPDFDPVYDMSFDGKHIYTCCRDGVVRMYIIENILNNLF